MADLLLYCLIAILGMAYLCTVAATFIKLYRLRLQACKDCREGYDCFDHDMHWIPAVLGALVWPVTVPMLYTALRADPERTRRKNEALQRRIAELEKEAGLHG